MATDNRNQSGNQGGDRNRDDQSGGQDRSSGQDQYNQNQGSSGNIDEMNTNEIENVDGSNWSPGKVGEVEDKNYDGRLKENRAEGRTLGTTPHSSKAPHEKDRDDSSGSDGGGNSNQ